MIMINQTFSDPQQGCVASSGPAAGSACIFPFIYEGVRYEGCAPLIGWGHSDNMNVSRQNPHCSGLSNLYSSLYWCSTKVDINGFHIRGPYNNKGVCTCQYWIFLIIIVVIIEICWILWRHLSENQRNLLLDLIKSIEYINWISAILFSSISDEKRLNHY